MQKIKKEITEHEALQKLMALCARTEHCSFEMKEKMKRWGLTEEARQRVVDQLCKARYIDDERYARAFANDKTKYNKWGKRKVDQVLFMKHISEDIRRRVLDEIEDDNLMESLRELLFAKMKTIKAKSDYEMTGKLIRFAMSRGFGFDEIKKALPEIDQQ